MIVTVSGLDGAGKSTQIALLSKSLEENGLSVRVLWARGGYTPGFEFLKTSLRAALGKKAIRAGHSQRRRNQFNKPLVKRLWLTIAICDLCFYWGVYVRVLLHTHSVVICDRYIGDTLLDFRRNFPDIDVENIMLWRLLQFACPKPKVSFLFWIPVQVSISRSARKNEPFPDSKETLEWRMSQYMDNEVFPRERNYLIDGRGDVEETAKQVLSVVYSKGFK